MQSIEITPATASIVGIGSSQQLTVKANYSNGKSQDFTARVTYTLESPTGPVLAPAGAIALTDSGRVQVVNAACTWTAPTVSYPYVVTATFKEFTSKSFVNVSATVGCGTAPANAAVKYILPNQSE